MKKRLVFSLLSTQLFISLTTAPSAPAQTVSTEEAPASPSIDYELLRGTVVKMLAAQPAVNENPKYADAVKRLGAVDIDELQKKYEFMRSQGVTLEQMIELFKAEMTQSAIYSNELAEAAPVIPLNPSVLKTNSVTAGTVETEKDRKIRELELRVRKLEEALEKNKEALRAAEHPVSSAAAH